MSSLLLDEPLLCYQPALVRRIGLAEAAIVQQLQFWLVRSTNTYEGQQWVYKTYDEWSGEIGISAKAVRGALDRLRKTGLVVAMQSPLDSRDRTLWWRIDKTQLGEGGNSGGPSAPAGRPSVNCLAGGDASAPGGSSHAGVQGRTKITTETTNGEKRPDARERIPDDFPDELRPHAREVMRILKAIAADHPTAKAVWPREVALAVMAFPRHPLVQTAHALAGWAVDPPRPIKDVASTYRTFLKRERALGAVERLADDGSVTTDRPAGAANVHPIHGRRMSEAERVEAQIQALS